KVLLDKNLVEKNPGKRFIAKIMLNSFWGKLAQRSNFPKTAICKTYDQFWKILNDDTLEILGEHQVNDDTILLCYKEKDENECNPGNTNIAVSSYVTTYARLHLYKFMDQVVQNGTDRLLYFDTDSILYIKREGDIEIKTGDFLGDMTDEISGGWGKGAQCIRFASAGPKNYAFEVLKPDGTTEVVLKTKGIANYAKTLSVLNMEQMVKMVQNYIEKQTDILPVEQFVIKSNKYTHNVVSSNFFKIYKVVSEKRRIVGNFTLPYGYSE
ncbi:MAG: DNA polymerase, partial [Limnohabitans sp.]|nr:DNA polymerase [Limnohabitans sp.]